MRAPQRVYLWSIDNPTIIVPSPTGVLYCNQVDGVATAHRELEGYLLPLPRLTSHVFDPKWWGRLLNRRTDGDAQTWSEACHEIERTLASVVASGEAPRELRVVEHEENAEAWVHVSFLLPQLERDGAEGEPTPLSGILTWQNCD